MSTELLLEAVFVLNPRTGKRARLLVCAVQLLRSGVPRRDVVSQIRERFSVAQPVAWRVVEMAADMAVKGKP
jgi:hypothetical protein